MRSESTPARPGGQELIGGQPEEISNSEFCSQLRTRTALTSDHTPWAIIIAGSITMSPLGIMALVASKATSAERAA
jgi:hypothetical protein